MPLIQITYFLILEVIKYIITFIFNRITFYLVMKCDQIVLFPIFSSKLHCIWCCNFCSFDVTFSCKNAFYTQITQMYNAS